jgi:hypothetical protein
MKASLFWPSELTRRETSASIIPLLLETQDKFISLLDVSDARPDSWKAALQATGELKANVFLKHLMVLADFGGEPLKRLRPQMQSIFPTGIMTFAWRGATYEYRFKAIIGVNALDNKSLHVDGKSLVHGCDLDDRMEDVIMLLLHGAAAINAPLPDMIKEKCVIGSLMGEKAELEKFVKQRYIWVSRITSGATSNALGQLAQDYVRDVLKQALPDWSIIRNGTIPGISQTAGKTDITFDLVAKSPAGHYTAIEVSFQVTTNSVIERKAGQAQARAALIHQGGHRIAYVIDGAGNFERTAALQTICRNSDCTVALMPDERAILVEFLQQAL